MATLAPAVLCAQSLRVLMRTPAINLHAPVTRARATPPQFSCSAVALSAALQPAALVGCPASCDTNTNPWLQFTHSKGDCKTLCGAGNSSTFKRQPTFMPLRSRLQSLDQHLLSRSCPTAT